MHNSVRDKQDGWYLPFIKLKKNRAYNFSVIVDPQIGCVENESNDVETLQLVFIFILVFIKRKQVDIY